MHRHGKWQAICSMIRAVVIGGLTGAVLVRALMKKDDPHEGSPSIDYDSVERIKLIDLHKMYADRVTGIRAIMIPLVAVMTALLGLMATLRDELHKQLWIAEVLIATLILTFVIGMFLRWRVGQLVKDYEHHAQLAERYKNRRLPLLPIDSLMTSAQYAERGYTELGFGWPHRISTRILLVSVAIFLMLAAILVIDHIRVSLCQQAVLSPKAGATIKARH
jgi:hypothetical protein